MATKYTLYSAVYRHANQPVAVASSTATYYIVVISMEFMQLLLLLTNALIVE